MARYVVYAFAHDAKDPATGQIVPVNQVLTVLDVEGDPNEQVVPEGFSIVPDDGTRVSWTPAPPPPVVPERVSPAQARIVLASHPSPNGENRTLLDDVNDVVNQAGGTIKLAWEYHDYVERHGVLVTQMQPIFGFTDEFLDQLFIEGGKVKI